jgi:hypothetical protein
MTRNLTTRPQRGQSTEDFQLCWEVTVWNHKEFDTAGALRGRTWAEYGSGQLSGDALTQFHTEANEIDFIVYSYTTPIAWHSTASGWTCPPDRYSVTTSHHQSLIRKVLS